MTKNSNVVESHVGESWFGNFYYEGVVGIPELEDNSWLEDLEQNGYLTCVQACGKNAVRII